MNAGERERIVQEVVAWVRGTKCSPSHEWPQEDSLTAIDARHTLSLAIPEGSRVVHARFPIQGGPSIPWEMIEPHDRQCELNHCGQDLKRMAERGGPDSAEALAILDDVGFTKRWAHLKTNDEVRTEARDELERRRLEFEGSRVCGPDEVPVKVEDLRGIEWAATLVDNDTTETPECPDCGATKGLIDHHPDCWLAAALKGE